MVIRSKVQMVGVKDTMKHAWIYSAAAVLGKIVGFIMLPFYSHILRDEGYAVIGLLDAGLALLTSMLAYGVQGANIRFYHDQKDPQDKKGVISTGVLLVLAASGILVIPVMLFSRPITGLLLDNPDYNHLLIMALVAFVFQMGGQGAASWMLIQRKSVQFASINLFKLVIGLSLNILLILVLDMGLNGYFISSLITAILADSVFILIALRNCGTRFDRTIAIQIRDFLMPLIPSNLASFLSRQIERFLVKFQIDLSSVGVLEMAYKFPVLIGLFITTPFHQSWNTRRYEIADQEGAHELIGQMLTYYLFLLSFMGLLMAVVIKPVIVILTPPEFHAAYRIARVEILTTILIGLYYQVSFGLLYAKHTKVLARIRGWTSAVKVVISCLLISWFGLVGAAWSAAIIAMASTVIGFVLSQRRYRMQMEWKKIIMLASLSLGIFWSLSAWDASRSSAFMTIEQRWLPAMADSLEQTPLGTWKEGRLPAIMRDRSTPVAEMVIKGGLALPYGLLIFVVHNGFRNRILTKLRGENWKTR